MLSREGGKRPKHNILKKRSREGASDQTQHTKVAQLGRGQAIQHELKPTRPWARPRRFQALRFSQLC